MLRWFMLRKRKRYERRLKGRAVPSPLVMKIVLAKSRAYKLHNFSMLSLRALADYHSKAHLPSRWRLSKDEKTLILE